MFFFIPVTGNKFPVTKNIVYFTGKDPSVTRSILPVTGSFTCDMGIFHHVTGDVPPITGSTVCITWRILSATGRIFHSAFPQEIFFLWDKVIICSFDTRYTSCMGICSFSCMGIHPMCKTVFFLSEELFFLWERIDFLWSLGFICD